MKERAAKILPALPYFLIVLTVIMLIISGIPFFLARENYKPVVLFENVTAEVNGSEEFNTVLPHSFKGLKGRTPVSLTGKIKPAFGDAIYIKTVYAPVKIFVDGEMIFEMGNLENYPRFMKDPATEEQIIKLNGDGSEKTLRLEFLSPLSRSTLTVHPPMIGSSENIIYTLFRSLWFPLMFSTVQMIYGISLAFISVFIIFADKKGISFLFLGLFSFATGMWSFAENNFTGLILKNPALLYLLSFIGFFTFIIPLAEFTKRYVDFKNKKPAAVASGIMSVIIAAALILQFAGVIPFSASMYAFHILLPSFLLFLTGITIFEFVKYKTITSKRFIFPIAILTVSAISELLNYRFPLTYIFSSLFQLGILVFLIIVGCIAGLSVKDSLGLAKKQRELELLNGLIDIRVREQQSQSEMLAKHEEILRRQRHDLRHHLAVIMDLAGNDKPQLTEYLSSLSEKIPKSEQRLCENRAVNSVINHYYSLCKTKGIALTLNIDVPANNPNISDSNLCVIFGNLLENAVEACCRMTEGEKFIKLSSSVRNGMIIITQDNSFDGKIAVKEGRFRSSKRDDFGIGVASMHAIAKNFNGNTEFKTQGNVFLSSIYFEL